MKSLDEIESALVMARMRYYRKPDPYYSFDSFGRIWERWQDTSRNRVVLDIDDIRSIIEECRKYRYLRTLAEQQHQAEMKSVEEQIEERMVNILTSISRENK